MTYFFSFFFHGDVSSSCSALLLMLKESHNKIGGERGKGFYIIESSIVSFDQS